MVEDANRTGSAVPEPTIELPPLTIDVTSVASFGRALLAEAEDIETIGGTIQEQLKNPEGDEHGRLAAMPFGSDPRQTTLNMAAIRHSEKMAEMNTFISNVGIGLRGLGNITAAICAEYGDQDALNAADTDHIAEIINDANHRGQAA